MRAACLLVLLLASTGFSGSGTPEGERSAHEVAHLPAASAPATLAPGAASQPTIEARAQARELAAFPLLTMTLRPAARDPGRRPADLGLTNLLTAVRVGVMDVTPTGSGRVRLQLFAD